MLSVFAALIAGCGQTDATPSSSAAVPQSRPCVPNTLRLHGSYQASLGSQFGAVTISAAGEGTCQLRGGRPKVLVYVAGKPISVAQTHSKDVALSDGPRVLTVPVTRSRSGPGFAFEWQETCRPKGPISVVVQLPGMTRKLRVAPANRIVGPRCSPGSGVAPTVLVSLLGLDLAQLIIN